MGRSTDRAEVSKKEGNIDAWSAAQAHHVWVLAQFGEPLSNSVVWLSAAHTAGLMFAAFDVLLPFSLFSSFDGRRVWDWNWPAWGALAAVVLGLFFVGG